MKEDFYITLLYKQLAEEISPSEKAQLETWLAESKANRLTAASVEKAWNASDLLQAEVDVDLDAEFGALEALLEEDEEEVPPIKGTATIRKIEATPSPRRNWLAMAATILVIAVAAFLFRSAFDGSGNNAGEWVSIITENEPHTVTLPDNSTVYLNANSELSYLKEFTADKRMLQLKGEAFFEVEHDAARPFEVQTGAETITVLGTSFNVQTSDNKQTTVYVATGKVQVAQQNNAAKIVLKKGEQGISNSTTKEVKNLGQQTANALAWRSKRLEFVDTPISEVIQAVEKLYNITIKLEKENLLTCRFNSTFDNQKANTVLEVISTVLGAEMEKKSTGVYLIKGGSCE